MSSESSPRPPSPVEPPPLPVPADHALRANHQQVTPPPARPRARKPDPKKPVLRRELGAWIAPEGDLKLVTENQVLEHDVPPRPQHGAHGAKQYVKEAAHRRKVPTDAALQYSDPLLPPYTPSGGEHARRPYPITTSIQGPDHTWPPSRKVSKKAFNVLTEYKELNGRLIPGGSVK